MYTVSIRERPQSLFDLDLHPDLNFRPVTDHNLWALYLVRRLRCSSSQFFLIWFRSLLPDKIHLSQRKHKHHQINFFKGKIKRLKKVVRKKWILEILLAKAFSNCYIIVRRDTRLGCMKQPNQNLTPVVLSPSGLLQKYFRKGFCFPLQLISLPQLINVCLNWCAQ